MPFPEFKRVIFHKNPLDKVICQLRFPSILKIVKEIPADFQELIRENFPLFTEQPGISNEIPAKLRGAVPQEILNQISRFSDDKNYEFSSEDGIWKINLSSTFIALSAKKYERWEKFKDKLMLPLKTLEKVYKPSYFTRIGLRYVDIITRSKIGIKRYFMG